MKRFLTVTLASATLILGATTVAQDAAVEEAESREQFRSLDRDVQDLKKEVLDLNRDLFLLEEELLFPANSQVAFFISMDVGEYFALDSVNLKIDGKEVANYLYTEREVDALMRDGVDAMNEGQLDVAIRLFGAATEKAPNYAEGWNKRATVLFYAGYPDESMHDIQRTLALEPRHFGAISGMGLIFMQRQDWASALRAFEQVLEIHPSAQHAHVHVMELRKKLAAKGA